MRGLDLPILLRFNGILKDRLREIHDVFAAGDQASTITRANTPAFTRSR